MSGALGPGVSSWIGHRRGETTSSGVSGCPSRIVSRNPSTAGASARSRIRSVLTRLMPIFTLTRSAGVSRIVRAVNGSSSALPPNPRFTRSTPARPAARIGQAPVGWAALDPWLMELPWCSHTRRPEAGTGSRAASVRSATSSVVSSCGSQISTFLGPSPRSANRRVPVGPDVRSEPPVVMSMVRVLPPTTLPWPASRPSITRS